MSARLAPAPALMALAMLLAGSMPAQAQDGVDAAVAAPPPASVVVLHRKVALLRANFLGVSPAERASRAQQTIEDLLDKGGPGVVTATDVPQGKVLMIDGSLALILVPGDANTTSGESLDSVSRATVAALSQAIAETRESRDQSRLAHAAILSLVATLFFALAVWVAWRVRLALMARTNSLIETKAADVQVGGQPLMHPSRLRLVAHRLVAGCVWLVIVAMAYQWLVYVLTRFAYTRAWGEQLGNFLLGVLRHVASSILNALPDLTVALFILLLARAAIALARPVFDRAERGQSSFSWLAGDLAVPTRRIFTTAVWLFAIAMAYPYLPGAQSEAFKGISVLVGLMLTLGGSSLVGQGASGLILMYSRTIRVGEFVRINDQEGTVTDLGTFTTKIRTGLGEEISMPNSMIMSSVTKNYSRTVRGPGYILDTVMTIGYDTPWRQVEAMMVEAARRTDGVLEVPPPKVFKTGLQDFYVEYRLVCQAIPSQPRPRAEVMQLLHSNLIDVFNEHGVQIMSPHYFADPAQAKVVPRAQWWTPPAQQPPAQA